MSKANASRKGMCDFQYLPYLQKDGSLDESATSLRTVADGERSVREKTKEEERKMCVCVCVCVCVSVCV